MSFGSSFVQSMTPGLREILSQAIQTREAKKRYEEYFRMQGMADATRHGYDMAEAQGEALNEIAKKDAERSAADKARIASGMVGYYDPATGLPTLGFDGKQGRPSPEHAIYRSDLTPSTFGELAMKSLAPEEVLYDYELAGQPARLPANTLIDALRLAETKRSNKETEDRLRNKQDDPTPDTLSPNELNQTINALYRAIEEGGNPLVTQYQTGMDKFTEVPLVYAGEMEQLRGFLKQGMAPAAAIEATLADGVSPATVSAQIIASRDLSRVNYDGKSYRVAKNGIDKGTLFDRLIPDSWAGSDEMTFEEAKKYLTDRGYDPRVAERYLKQIGGSPSGGSQGTPDASPAGETKAERLKRINGGG